MPLAKGILEPPRLDAVSRAPLPSLGAALAKVEIPHEARILILGGGSAGAQKQLSPILAAHEGPAFLIDTNGKDTPRVTHVGNDLFATEYPDTIDLCIAMPPLARMPDAVEGLLYDGILAALKDGGIVAVPLPRDATERTLIAQGATLSRIRTGLQSFLERQFGAQLLASPDAIKQKFNACPSYEFVALASRTRPEFAADPIVWMILRKRTATGARAGGSRAFPRTPRLDQFALFDLEAFLRGMQGAGIEFLPVDRFAERYAAFCALGKRRRKARASFAHVKFDIHGNVQRAVEIAALLHCHSVPGLFLMMHRHPLNQEFYDAPSTWRMLREIEKMGHEIGIHADPFCLIRETGSLQRGLKAAVADLRKRGFAIRTATLHGDTREHIKARQLQANDFFREKYRRSKWDGLPPDGEEELAKHTYRYSHRRIANQIGLEYFAEVNFLHKGKLISDEPMLYVSDNARTIRVSSIPDSISPRDQIAAKKPFVIDPEFIGEVVEILRQRPFLALFHPQWYW